MRTKGKQLSLNSHDVNDPIRYINARYQEEAEVIFEGSEEKILRDFCNYVLTKDPDILLSPKPHYRSTIVLKYLFSRIEERGIDVGFGRDGQTENRATIEKAFDTSCVRDNCNSERIR